MHHASTYGVPTLGVNQVNFCKISLPRERWPVVGKQCVKYKSFMFTKK